MIQDAQSFSAGADVLKHVFNDLIMMDVLSRILAILTAAQRVLLNEQMKKEELHNKEIEEAEEAEDTVEERNVKVNDSFLYMRTATKLAMNMAQAAKLASNYSLSSIR